MHVSKRPHLSQHRRQRLVLWTLTMLAWVALVVLAGCRIGARRARQRGDVTLWGLARRAMQLVVLRAAEIARPQRRRPLYWRGRDQRRSQLFRALIGSAFRRALRHREIAECIRRLTHMLRNLDAYAVPIAKRMRRHLTRLWPIATAPTPAAPLFDAPLFPAAIADSS